MYFLTSQPSGTTSGSYTHWSSGFCGYFVTLTHRPGLWIFPIFNCGPLWIFTSSVLTSSGPLKSSGLNSKSFLLEIITLINAELCHKPEIRLRNSKLSEFSFEPGFWPHYAAIGGEKIHHISVNLHERGEGNPSQDSGLKGTDPFNSVCIGLKKPGIGQPPLWLCISE